MADLKISALTDGAPALGSDILPVARGGGNRRLTVDNVKSLITAPITIAIGDVATATDLIDGQLYSVTGLSAFTSAVQLTDLRFYAYKDTANIGAVPAVMSSYGIANYSAVGVVRTCEIIIDWYGSGNVEFVNDFWKNEIEGFANINIFPFGSAERKGNKVGSGFTLDITALGSEKFNYNTCFGNGTFTATTGRDYEDIDFTKGYFDFNFQFSYDGNPTPNGASIVIQKNELGVVPTVSHPSAGGMKLTSGTSCFGATIDKCSLVFQHVYDGASFITMTADWIGDTEIDISIWDSLTGSLADLAVANVSFRVQVYF